MPRPSEKQPSMRTGPGWAATVVGIGFALPSRIPSFPVGTAITVESAAAAATRLRNTAVEAAASSGIRTS